MVTRSLFFRIFPFAYTKPHNALMHNRMEGVSDFCRLHSLTHPLYNTLTHNKMKSASNFSPLTPVSRGGRSEKEGGMAKEIVEEEKSGFCKYCPITMRSGNTCTPIGLYLQCYWATLAT